MCCCCVFFAPFLLFLLSSATTIVKSVQLSSVHPSFPQKYRMSLRLLHFASSNQVHTFHFFLLFHFHSINKYIVYSCFTIVSLPFFVWPPEKKPYFIYNFLTFRLVFLRSTDFILQYCYWYVWIFQRKASNTQDVIQFFLDVLSIVCKSYTFGEVECATECTWSNIVHSSTLKMHQSLCIWFPCLSLNQIVIGFCFLIRAFHPSFLFLLLPFLQKMKRTKTARRCQGGFEYWNA